MTNPKFKVASSVREETKCSSNSKEYMSDLLHSYVSQMGDMCALHSAMKDLQCTCRRQNILLVDNNINNNLAHG